VEEVGTMMSGRKAPDDHESAESEKPLS
jgi:hypothetical protein